VNNIKETNKTVKVKYPEVGICGLSCRLCPAYNAEKSWCGGGCKSETRIAVGCSFITCALKRQEVEFCWECGESDGCEKWKKHREYGKRGDSFKCYQTLEKDIEFIRKNGVSAFVKEQKRREALLRAMLDEFNDGRSKSYYCIAATVMNENELKRALIEARKRKAGLDVKERARLLHSILDRIAGERRYVLKLKKPK
jgi:hypothetical protein